MREFFTEIFQTVKNISFFDFVDIACVAVLFYFLYKFMRDRRSGKLIVGIVLLFVLEFVSRLFDMYVIQFILQNIFRVGLIVIAVIFQPELRSALEKVGGQPFKSLKSMSDVKASSVEKTIDVVVTAVGDLSLSKTGALIVFERTTKLGELILTGTVIDAFPSSYLVKNIFFNKSPLHDGALIVRDSRLHAAGCLLPLSQNTDILKALGTRHRAAIGMSENSDAVIVVVSEETGTISVAVEGVLYRDYNKESLAVDLKKYLLTDIGTNQRGSFIQKLNVIKNKKSDRRGEDE